MGHYLKTMEDVGAREEVDGRRTLVVHEVPEAQAESDAWDAAYPTEPEPVYDPELLPPTGTMVTYHCRPGEGRMGKLEFPAMVMHRETDNRTVALLVFYDADDFGMRARIQERSDDQPFPAFSYVKGAEPERFEPTRINHIRKDLDDARERLDRMISNVYGPYDAPQQPLVDILAGFEQAIDGLTKRIATLEKPKGKSAKA